MTDDLAAILPPSRPCIGCGEPTAAYNGHGQPQCFSCFANDIFGEYQDEEAERYQRDLEERATS